MAYKVHFPHLAGLLDGRIPVTHPCIVGRCVAVWMWLTTSKHNILGELKVEETIEAFIRKSRTFSKRRRRF